MDSGIGGLPYFQHISSVNPHERFIYTADRNNFPYGSKDKETLVHLLEMLIHALVSIYDPKVIVLACNTASVTALDALRNRFPDIPFIGTVPAVKPAALKTRSGIIGVLGTQRTIEDPYIEALVKESGRSVEVKKIAAPLLVDFVEHQYASASTEERLHVVSKYIDELRAAGVDALVLGCTHFLFLLDEFRKAASPGIEIYDSIEGVSQRLGSVLNKNKLRTSVISDCDNILLVTGKDDAEPVWKQRAEMYNMELKVFGRILEDKGKS